MRIIGNVFLELSLVMEAQNLPDMDGCMSEVLRTNCNLPPNTGEAMLLLGKSIGRFDLEGQVKGLESVRQDCRRYLDKLTTDREPRLRSYQTLGLCAGAALAILFV